MMMALKNNNLFTIYSEFWNSALLWRRFF